MKKQYPWEFYWKLFIMLMGICIPATCSWLFLDEFSIAGVQSSKVNRIIVGWFATGTLGYAVVYISLTFAYPRSKQECFPSLFGPPIQVLSIGGFWILYLLSLLLGPIGVVLYTISVFRSFAREG